MRRFARNGRDGTDDHAGLIYSRPPDNTRVSKGVWGSPHHCFAGALPREAGAPPQNQRARPHWGRKGARGLRLLPLNQGELANSMKGQSGGERANRTSALSQRPAPRGPRRKGDERRSGPVNPKGGVARLRGGRGAPRFLQPRRWRRRAVAPCGFPPLACSSLKGGSGRGDSKGGKLMGGNSVDQGRPPRSFVGLAGH